MSTLQPTWREAGYIRGSVPRRLRLSEHARLPATEAEGLARFDRPRTTDPDVPRSPSHGVVGEFACGTADASVMAGRRSD